MINKIFLSDFRQCISIMFFLLIAYVNIVVIDFKDRGILHMSKIDITGLQMSKIKIGRWRLLKVLFLVSLDTLFLNVILLYIPGSNRSTSYIVGNLILIPFQRYMTFSLTP
jgi:hypothetical protein